MRELFPDTPRFDNDPRDWDWEAAIKECRSNDVIEDSHGDCRYHALFIGTVMSLAPSGKYWTWWACSNVTEEEAQRDEEYFDILYDCANEVDGWIESGEGDPCDIFFCLPQQDSEELDEYFETYAKEFMNDVGGIPENLEPYIDWEKLASDLRCDYSCIEVDGNTYWVRS